MINPNDAFTIDWTNPTTHMLAGQAAGRAEAAEDIERLEAEVERLQGIVDKLPKNADKDPIYLGSEQWAVWDDGETVERFIIDGFDFNSIDVSDRQLIVRSGLTEIYASECYSTKAAAEAAKDKEGE